MFQEPLVIGLRLEGCFGRREALGLRNSEEGFQVQIFPGFGREQGCQIEFPSGLRRNVAGYHLFPRQPLGKPQLLAQAAPTRSLKLCSVAQQHRTLLQQIVALHRIGHRPQSPIRRFPATPLRQAQAAAEFPPAGEFEDFMDLGLEFVDLALECFQFRGVGLCDLLTESLVVGK